MSKTFLSLTEDISVFVKDQFLRTALPSIRACPVLPEWGLATTSGSSSCTELILHAELCGINSLVSCMRRLICNQFKNFCLAGSFSLEQGCIKVPSFYKGRPLKNIEPFLIYNLHLGVSSQSTVSSFINSIYFYLSCYHPGTVQY